MSAPISAAKASYTFTDTQDWFSHNIEHWAPLLQLVKSHAPRVLEIGSWEGRSAIWLLENLCGTSGEIVCIDHFDLFDTKEGKERFTKINHNLGLTGKAFRVIPQFSVPALMQLLQEEVHAKDPGYDWLYIDGSHEADDTMLDGELAWRLAREGAIIIFDDYHWDAQPEDSVHHPKRGIDTFLALHVGEYERFTQEDAYQVVIRKLTPMRIGFLMAPDSNTENVSEENTEGKVNTASSKFDYGINIALAVDSAFVVGAAVTIHSALQHAPLRRITIYIVDCGLTTEDKQHLQAVGQKHSGVTMLFRELPETSLARQMGPVWAKIDMLSSDVLPVQRVLYLDSDTLVRRDLFPLWETDLQGKSIGAVIDIGHPMGHDEGNKRPYFNAGVLLFDLARVRERLFRLKELSPRYRYTKYRDQDALNEHFGNAAEWLHLDLIWNAQGLGTYARYPSAEREALPLATMQDPNIVHFTGPVNPSVVEVLNPYVQPPTAKPWGYLGAPGHPYAAEWRRVFGEVASESSKDLMIDTHEHARRQVLIDVQTEFDSMVRRLTNSEL